MNMELMAKIGELIDYACGWRQSFYRRYPNGHHTPLIKYFDFRIDTRDMNAWLISLDTHEGQESFRLDNSGFGLLVEFLDIPTSNEMASDLDDYPITSKLVIGDYTFTRRANSNDIYFVTMDIDDNSIEAL